MTSPTIAQEAGVKEFPGVGKAYAYKLSLGHAYCLTNGEWKLTPVIKSDQRSTEYAWKIIWVQGRACAVFTVLGQEKWAQPINGNMAPAQERAEKAKARAAKISAAAQVVEVKPEPLPEPPAEKPKKRKRVGLL